MSDSETINCKLVEDCEVFLILRITLDIVKHPEYIVNKESVISTWSTTTSLQNVLEGGLEQTVTHLVPVLHNFGLLFSLNSLPTCSRGPSAGT